MCLTLLLMWWLLEVYYNSAQLIRFAGDNTRGGEENDLINLWLIPTSTASLNLGIWGNWFKTPIGNMTVTFETCPNGTTFSLGCNQNFVPSSSYITKW